MNLLNFMTLDNSKVQNKKFKSLWNEHLKILSKHFAGIGKEKHLLNDYSIKQREKCQSECYAEYLNWVRFCRRTSLHILTFPISLLKRNMDSYWRWKTSERKIWPFFVASINRDLFLYNTFISYLFQENIEMELKINLHNIWRTFRMKKIKNSNSIFWTDLYFMQINNTYINQGLIDIPPCVS